MAGGAARIIEEPGGRVFTEQHLHARAWLADLDLTRGETELAEFHCMLERRSALQRLGPHDEGLLSSREHIDLCLAVREAGGKVFFEPGSIVTYVPGPPFSLPDALFYLLRGAAYELAMGLFSGQYRGDGHPGCDRAPPAVLGDRPRAPIEVTGENADEVRFSQWS